MIKQGYQCMANHSEIEVAKMDRVIQISTTGESRHVMEGIGRRLVEKRLASCAQISGPITSTYWWKGKIETTEEWVCTVKTTSRLYPKVEAMIRDLHPYDIPEIVAMNVENSLSMYADWVRKETGITDEGENI
jgi:periplasmic divalent cation tolerance protein